MSTIRLLGEIVPNDLWDGSFVYLINENLKELCIVKKLDTDNPNDILFGSDHYTYIPETHNLYKLGDVNTVYKIYGTCYEECTMDDDPHHTAHSDASPEFR